LIKKFYYHNFNIIFISLALSFATFFVNVIINPILIKDFHFEEVIINYSAMGFSIGFFLGTFFIRYILNHKINFFKTLNNFITFFMFIQLILLIYVYFSQIFDNNIYQSFYILIRLVEGFGATSVFFVIGYLISFKLLNNPYKGTLQGFYNSKSYAIKFLSPLIGSAFVLYTQEPLLLYVGSFLIYLLCYIYIYKNKNILFIKYHKYMTRKHQVSKKKLKSLDLKKIFNFSFFKLILKNDKLNKLLFGLEVFFQNLLRPFYDLYFVLIMTFIFKLNIAEASFLFTLMVLAMALSFKTAFLFDRLYKKLNEYKEVYQTFLSASFNILFFSWMLFLMHTNNEFFLENIYYVLMITSFCLGLIRNIFSDRGYRQILEYSLKDKKLEDYKSGNLIIGEMGHIIGYFLTGILFSLLSYIGIIYWCLFISFCLFILMIFKIILRRKNFI